MSKCGNCCYGVMTGPNRMFCSVQNCLCEEVFDCEDYEPIVKPQTNADRIRKMSDEELAHFLDRWALGDIDYSRTFCDMCEGQFDCDDCRLWWLKKEADS